MSRCVGKYSVHSRSDSGTTTFVTSKTIDLTSMSPRWSKSDSDPWQPTLGGAIMQEVFCVFSV